ncbi:hypothetical protein ACF3NA_09000 [Alkanindiges sp. WGS2144]|uniref:hypothetical protein n=1 Tax=Alkanindiges sp. WGS2144 TaxID=3366808 RepID=UPI0037533210
MMKNFTIKQAIYTGSAYSYKIRVAYFLASLLLVGGCQDISKNEQEESSVVKTDVIQQKDSINVESDEPYSAEGLARFDQDDFNLSEENIFEETLPASEKSPVRFELKLNPVWAEYGLGMIEIQAITDRVTIEKVILNRGQCSAIDNSRPMPVNLVFGRTYTGYINNCALDKIIEVQINTNLGNWTFTQ